MTATTLRPTEKRLNPIVGVSSSSTRAEYHHLPRHVIPDKYIICIKPRWEDASFEGSEIIHITICKETSEIVMNAADLTIAKVRWEEDVTENRQEPLEVSIDAEKELLKILFEPPLSKSNGTLTINFHGVINTKRCAGVYKSNLLPHTSDATIPEFYCLTNFWPFFARRCFPCWDEPSFKVSFEIGFILPSLYTALSNMPVKITFPHRSNSQLFMVECLPSPIMSPHGVGFCLGKFEFLRGKTNDNLQYRIYTEIGKKKYGKYAAKSVGEFLPFFRDYFGTPFPMAKLDFLIVPEVARETVRHWGLITCRDTSLFVEEESTPMFLQAVTSLLAREVAQQWFGNLVTCDWFNYLWLNQGLSYYTAQIAMENIAPQYQIWSQFVCNICIPALDADSNPFSPPIETPVNNLAEYTDLNDFISCKKGACLIRMLLTYVGPNDFRKGIVEYLDRYQHLHLTSLDFFAVMEQISGRPVVAVFNTWMKTPGYPLIRVSSKQQGNYRTFTLTQERFCVNLKDAKGKEGRNSGRNKDDHLWKIPITFSSASQNELLSTVLEKKSTSITLLIGKAHWVSINPGHCGYFRVHYSPNCFAQLLSAVRQKTLPVSDRMSLLNDVHAMTQDGICSTLELLHVLEAYTGEKHYTVWKVIASTVTRLALLLDSSDFYNNFQAFVRFIFSNIARRTTYEVKENEDHLVAFERYLILSQLIRFRNPTFLKQAQNIFAKHQKEGTIIHPSVRTPIYQAVLQDADVEMIQTFFKMYHDSESLEEQGRIARSLGAVVSVEMVKLVLYFAIGEGVRRQHTVLVLQSLGSGSSSEGREFTWSFFKEHWSLFCDKFLGSDMMVELVKSLIANFASEEKSEEITEFFRDHHIAGTDRMILLHAHNIRTQEALLKRDGKLIQEYLSSYA